jgi:hypothetical protein
MKTRLKIGVIDLVCKGPTHTLWGKIMHANLASIMPQVIATWCEEEGHEVKLVCYTGREELGEEFAEKFDVIFISSFTQAALFSYALSNYFRSRGAVTVLGGPHARCYPDDAVKYFDYVLGFTNKEIIGDILADRHSSVAGRRVGQGSPQRAGQDTENPTDRPEGIHLAAGKQPHALPGIRERWKYIESTLKKAPFLKMVPMIGSMGCPYTCSFCIDSVVPYQPLNFQDMKEDLQFLLTKFKRPMIAWHDPNFGVRFEDNMEAIATAAPRNSFRFIAESSLSILTEKHLKVFRENGFTALLPGVETWYELGNKSRTGAVKGEDKVKQVAEHVNMILDHVPYVQTNFVLGLDSDSGSEPFELTKKFIDLSPGAFPGYSLLTAFGAAAPLNLGYQREGRVLPFPFHFLNNHLAMNVKPRNYEWVDFYDKVIDLTEYSFSPKNIYRRARATHNGTSRWMNVMRAISSEGYGRIKFFRNIRQQLVEDRAFRSYFEGESTELPEFYAQLVKRDLGKWWEWLPEGALYHDQNAYLHKTAAKQKIADVVQNAGLDRDVA